MNTRVAKELFSMGLATVLVSLSAARAAADTSIIGEWAVDEESCSDSRLTFDAAGRHSAVMMEDGEWQTLSSAVYTVEGSELIIGQGDTVQRLTVETVSDQLLILHNPDSPLGPLTSEFVRCPE